MWLEKIFELLSGFYDSLKFWTIIDPYEEGVILRLGRFSRVIKVGFYWKFPIIENTLIGNIALTTMNLSPQSLTTKDGIAIVVSAIAKYQVKDIKIYLLDVWDAKDAISDICMGKITEVIINNDYETCRNIKFIQDEINKKVKGECLKWGVKVLHITLNDFQKTRSIRILMDREKIISPESAI